MCLLVFAWQVDPARPLIFAGNRDEFHDRPALPATFWADAPEVIGGLDCEAGGSWLGMTLEGRFAVVTNFREGVRRPPDAPSRGRLVRRWLVDKPSLAEFSEELALEGARYAGFSLIFGDVRELHYFSNRDGPVRRIPPGLHALSNALLDTPWPKVVKARERLETLLQAGGMGTADLFELLSDREPAPADRLPETGLDRERERALSSAFVLGSDYGTRCSTLVIARANGTMTLAERGFAATAKVLETRFFTVAPGASDRSPSSQHEAVP